MNISTINKGPRISLVTVFSAGLIGVVFIFMLVSYFTFSRLLSFESTLTNVSEKSLPNLIQINQLYAQAATLLESTDMLSKSSSNASKRLAEKQLRTNLVNTRLAAQEIFQNKFLDTQLNTIAIELEEFSALIDERQRTRNRLERLVDEIYQLNSQALYLKTEISPDWILGFSQAIVGVDNALNGNKQQRVRFLFNQLEHQLGTLHSEKFANTISHQLTNELEVLLFNENGLEALKIRSLILAGRTIGRENFVHSLIKDYVAQLGFVTSETEQNITSQVATSVVEMKEQTHLIRLLLIGGVVFLLVIFILFQQRVLKRISVFNQIVRNKTQESGYQTMLNGNDEITDLAEAFKEFAETIEIQKEKLEHLSMSDGLTGIPNRRALDIRLKHDIELSAREKYSTAILLMDIDCFKLYNDNYGHSAGDQCLKDVSKIIYNALQRDSDFVARYGGEEFICILPNTGIDGAKDLAANIIDKLKSEALPHKYSNVTDHITLSIGIAISSPNEYSTPDTMIKQADTALYVAKNSGKNTCSLYS